MENATAKKRTAAVSNESLLAKFKVMEKKIQQLETELGELKQKLEGTRDSSAALPEHSRVRLRSAASKAGLAKGAKGTVVHCYENGGYEVEFIAGLKRPVVLTVEADEIEALKAGR